MTFLRYILSLVLIVGSISGIGAKNPASALLIKSTPDATVVFVKPEKMSKAKDSDACKELEYDITAATLSDTIFFTASVITRMPMSTDSITITGSGDFCRTYPLERIFVEPKGDKWISRVRAGMPLAEFKELIALQQSPEFIFAPGSPSKVSFQDKQKKWDDRCRIYNLLIEILNRNYE